MLLGAIADDVTGATDLAAALTRHGMQVVQTLGVPEGLAALDADAVVVSLKSRTAPVDEAVSRSCAAARWLRARGARQFFFKYCSTFDSTNRGNIGPVIEALLEVLDAPATIACPAYPENGRTVYLGHLFVGTRLLSESGMRDHPLTPMLDPDLVRVLGRQCTGPVGLVPFRAVAAGPDAVGRERAALRERGVRISVADALSEEHLVTLGLACADDRLVTGGSGVATGLPENFRRAGVLPAREGAAPLPAVRGPVLMLAGSCSQATRRQVESALRRVPGVRVDPIALAAGSQTMAGLLSEVRAGLEHGAVLVHASAPPADVTAAQHQLGTDVAASIVEGTLASIAQAAVDLGVGALVVAGGDTSGAVTAALGLRALRIGPEIGPGVPWTVHVGSPELVVAFKSGNFGGPDFFDDALSLLRRQ